MNKKEFVFSVIIPVYNVQNYLEETIKSVLVQSLNFKNNIQIILVNDGSPDESYIICEKYQKIYPDNIVYIKKENGGVSSARNEGIKYAKGKYIAFLDSDDKWSKNYAKKMSQFFDKHPDVNIVTARMKFFDAKNGFHPLDYVYEKTRVIDIFENPSEIHLHITSSVIRKQTALKFSFDEKMKYAEDAKYVNEIITRDGKYGACREAVLYYRKRADETSAVQNQINRLDFYTVTPERFYNFMMELSEKLYGKVIEYVQNLIMYDLQWRLRIKVPTSIDKTITENYINTIRKIAFKIDDKIILEHQNVLPEYRIHLLNLKNKIDIRSNFKTKDNIIFYKDFEIMELNKANCLQLRTIEYNNDFIRIIGVVNLYLDNSNFNIYYNLDGKETKIDLEETIINDKFLFNKKFKNDYGFDIKIPNNFKKLSFKISYKNGSRYELYMNFKMNTKLNNQLKSYYCFNKHIYYCKNNVLLNKNKNILNLSFARIRYILYLLYKRKIKIIGYRFFYYLFKIFKNKKKELWIISDRTPVANDNGYAFYKYMCENHSDSVNSYFLINKDSKDLEKVKKTGKYLIYNSFKYKVYFLLADKIVSSQADGWETNAFNKAERFYRDLYNFKFVFLQHGIIKDDLSAWLNKYDKKIDIFVTSAPREYDSIVNNSKYGMGKEIIKLTGLPRYDLLNNNNKIKQIIFMPTWRKSLAKSIDKSNGIRKKNIYFMESEYYKFYNTLINDKRIIDKMQEKGYTGLFVSHPALFSNNEDFVENDTIKVCKDMVEYSKLFNESSLLITDFSSVPFDFAYLNKPVIYCQFDKDTFFEQHSYDEGYFEYERDGFGPVLYDYETAVKEIIKYLDNDCRIEKKYLERIKKFYKYYDKSNSKRVYEEILKLK